jgi:phosphoglycerate kinase
MSGKLLSISEIEVAGKAVLVRGDLDVEDGENPRTESIRVIVNLLIRDSAKRIKVIGHRETNFDICGQLRKEFPGVEFDDQLRADPGEKTNDEGYAIKLAEGWDVYINEAFATSHRKHASIDTLPRWMKKNNKPVLLGLRFEKEIEMLSQVWDKPGRRVLVIGGVKIEDKQKFAENMKDKFAAVLKGGLLPGVILRPDGLDIADETINKYGEEISTAEVILAAGVMGKYEDPGAAKGTKSVLEAIANNEKAYKVAGGGDIETAISTYGLTEKFDWISVGGGAMLEYLAMGTLVGIEAVR